MTPPPENSPSETAPPETDPPNRPQVWAQAGDEARYDAWPNENNIPSGYYLPWMNPATWLNCIECGAMVFDFAAHDGYHAAHG